MPNGPIGQPIPRVEGPAKVTGLIKYTADVDRPGVLWGKVLRSPLPHARILNVDTSRARNLPGVKAVITGRDVSPRLVGASLKDMPVLAQDRVRYVGEEVAAVAAVDADTAEEAVALIQVEYEELPAVFDPVEAMKPDAPIMHPDYVSYQGPLTKAPDLGNVQTLVQQGKGDIEIANAVYDATGVRITQLPIMPEKLISGLARRGFHTRAKRDVTRSRAETNTNRAKEAFGL